MSINKTFYFLVLILTFGLIINLYRDISRLIQAEDRVIKVEEKLEETKKENKELKQIRERYQSDDFLEEQIRNRLQMSKPGETVLILPEELTDSSGGEKQGAKKEEELNQVATNWQKWLELFK